MGLGLFQRIGKELPKNKKNGSKTGLRPLSNLSAFEQASVVSTSVYGQ